MDTFGEQLKQAREAQGVSLEAIAAETRIAVRHLASLEQSDLEGLPRGPFAKGFIRAYGGLPPDRSRANPRGLPRPGASAGPRPLREPATHVRGAVPLPGAEAGRAITLVPLYVACGSSCRPGRNPLRRGMVRCGPGRARAHLALAPVGGARHLGHESVPGSRSPRGPRHGRAPPQPPRRRSILRPTAFKSRTPV